jgi:hypothetical protein
MAKMGGGEREHTNDGACRWDWVAATALFVATACVVLWQNSRLAVLWDLSYIIDSAARIASGQTPYRDFPFAHAPLTFLIQAGILKLAGRVYWPHIAYCALVGALSSLAAWRIVLNVLRPCLPRARLLAFLLCLPLPVLGVYSIFPHPFYDPDCIAAVLASLLLLQGMDRRPDSVVRALAAGASIVVPVFIKQNIGVVFLAAAALVLALLAIIEFFRKQSTRRYLFCFGGMGAALIFALAVVQVTAGLDNYWRWTIGFAAARRMPAMADMAAIYSDQSLWGWLAVSALGVALLRFNRGRRRVLDVVGGVTVAAPFVWAAASLGLDADPGDQTGQLLAVWPYALIAGLLWLGLDRRWPADLTSGLTPIIVAAMQGAFLSQQLWGSTFAIWPLLSVLLACALASLAHYSKSSIWMPISSAALVSASLLIAGGAYVATHARLNYAEVDDGRLRHATIAPLLGLSLRGDQIPDFEALLAYAQRNIPIEDGIVLIPGEDPFYFATGRRPQFPVLLFDRSTNPYSVEELAALCVERRIRWLVVKRRLQLQGDPVEHRDQLMSALTRIYAPVAQLHNYEVYRLRPIATAPASRPKLRAH